MPKSMQTQPVRSTTKNALSTSRWRISQKFLRTFLENEKVFRRQAQEIVKAMRNGDVEPGELTGSKVLEKAGGAFGEAGVTEWCGVDEPIKLIESAARSFQLQ